MEVNGEGVNVYAEAKSEYTKQLCQFLVPSIHKYFLNLHEQAKEQQQDKSKHLVQLQILLEGISDWNIDKVHRETQQILISTQCDYIEELLTAVFIAHTKVLSAIRLTNKQKKLQITIPKLEHFLHRTLTECARHLWNNTFLFSSAYTPLERQKNMRQVEALISEGVIQGVRTMLPVKSILREYLSTDDESESEYETDASENDDDSDDDSDDSDDSDDDSDEESVKSSSSKASSSKSTPPKVQAEPVIKAPVIKAPVEAKPLVVQAKPPVVEAKAPVVEAKAPVVEAKAPVLVLDDGKPSVKFSEHNTIFDSTDNKNSVKDIEEELLFVDTDAIEFNDVEGGATGPTGKKAEEEDMSFEFEEIA